MIDNDELKALSRSLKCRIHFVEIQKVTVVFHLEYLHCPDMTQAIALAKVLQPRVTHIFALSGGNDTFYELAHGEWQAKRCSNWPFPVWYDHRKVPSVREESATILKTPPAPPLAGG
jgi:hypothetical protein